MTASQSQSQSQSQTGIVPDTPAVPSVHADPLVQSYTYRSPIPDSCRGQPCILGVDEAGRGPVLGPLVYGIAYCPATSSSSLKEVGFADSKQLTAERRDYLLSALIDNAETLGLGWSTRTMSPQDISAGMLRRFPDNLNSQSKDATVGLIAGILEAGVDISEIYVDTVGDPATYKKSLQMCFPQAKYKHIQWTVTSKADALFPIVGAASIAAKVTRDRWVEDWRYAESVGDDGSAPNSESDPSTESLDSASSPPPSPTKKASASSSKKRKAPAIVSRPVLSFSSNPHAFWHSLGSGYPSDPNTVAFLNRTLDPVFGWPGIVRFSWATVKTLLEERTRPSAAASAATTDEGSSSGSSRTKRIKDINGIASAAEPSLPVSQLIPLTSTLSRSPQAGQPKGYTVTWIDANNEERKQPKMTSFFRGGGGASATATATASGSASASTRTLNLFFPSAASSPSSSISNSNSNSSQTLNGEATSTSTLLTTYYTLVEGSLRKKDGGGGSGRGGLIKDLGLSPVGVAGI